MPQVGRKGSKSKTKSAHMYEKGKREDFEKWVKDHKPPTKSQPSRKPSPSSKKEKP